MKDIDTNFPRQKLPRKNWYKTTIQEHFSPCVYIWLYRCDNLKDKLTVILIDPKMVFKPC